MKEEDRLRLVTLGVAMTKEQDRLQAKLSFQLMTDVFNREIPANPYAWARFWESQAGVHDVQDFDRVCTSIAEGWRLYARETGAEPIEGEVDDEEIF